MSITLLNNLDLYRVINFQKLNVHYRKSFSQIRLLIDNSFSQIETTKSEKLLTSCDSFSISSPSSLDITVVARSHLLRERRYTRSRRRRSISSLSSLDFVAVVARSFRRRRSISSPSSLDLVVVARSRRVVVALSKISLSLERERDRKSGYNCERVIFVFCILMIQVLMSSF